MKPGTVRWVTIQGDRRLQPLNISSHQHVASGNEVGQNYEAGRPMVIGVRGEALRFKRDRDRTSRSSSH